ncbi:uncharacterized protein LOC134825355 [Bolinopsis microptera]|uniref:uncharacterized protein LOC134825355 n=1 Tax=Bolinopsis microptera TaxID=2820187 RepID=UPI00307911F8
MATLIEAVQEGNPEAVFTHLKRGADPNECTRLGLSSLHLAAVHDETEIVKSLIKFGGNVNKLTGWGSSVLHMAAHRGALSIVIALLERGADVNIRDDNCDTPLHLACSEGHTDIVRELLKAGGDTKVKNNAGNTAFEESLESDNSAELLSVLDSANPKSQVPEELPPLLEGCTPLLNQTEFVPDFDVPTNESYSSIIDQFSLPGGKLSEFDEKPPSDLLQSYTGTKSMNQAQKFSFVKTDRQDKIEQPDLARILSTKLTLGQSFSGSIDLLTASCSLSQMLNFENKSITGNSIDSAVYRETYELFKQINSGTHDPGEEIGDINPTFPSNMGDFTSSMSNGSALMSQGLKSQLGDSFLHSSVNSFSVYGTKESCNTADSTPIIKKEPSSFSPPSQNQVDHLISDLSPVLQHATVSAVKAALVNIARSVPPPWPDESGAIEVSKGEWLYGEDYVLVSNTPLNVQNVHEREGSCSLVFKILHQHYGPLVLKMMVNLLNQSEHDTGQSGTIFLKKQFSAEHSVPVSLPYHPNVVQMLHSYNASTTPFKRYLPLLVPSGLDVDVDMASRTSFLAMREYPFSLKNFVNKFVEQKVKLAFMDKDRIAEELHLVLLLLIQCLFMLHHMKKHNVVHRDIKLDNFMMRHSGQVILIDFGWAVNLNNSDGSPAIATDKNEIIAGNPVAWSPEISFHHNSFNEPVLFSSVYDKSDLYTLGKTFLSVFEVLGFVEKDSSGFAQCPVDLASVPHLVESISLLQDMTLSSPDQRISVTSTLLSLGAALFFPGCDTPAQILSQYIKMTLSDSTSHSHAVTDIETLAVVKSLHAIVGKQFISTVTPEDLIGACIPRAANAVS